MSSCIHSDEIFEAVSHRANPYKMRQRRRLKQLSPEQRSTIERGYERHRRACENTGIDPDPYWIAEAIESVVNGEL